jgi:hypothetical protein
VHDRVRGQAELMAMIRSTAEDRWARGDAAGLPAVSALRADPPLWKVRRDEIIDAGRLIGKEKDEFGERPGGRATGQVITTVTTGGYGISRHGGVLSNDGMFTSLRKVRP